MADRTHIEWTRGDDGTPGATWNPVIGCTKVSPGCDHCYAIRTAHRMQANPNPKVSEAYAGTETGGEWTGRVNLLGDRLDQPLRWRRPRRIFVNAQSDLFHDAVPDEFIARVFAVMGTAWWHTFQVLTKRHARMRALLNSPEFVRLYDREWCSVPNWAARTPDPDRIPPGHVDHLGAGPLSNVWLGVSVEDQQWADIRIPALLDTPAAVRFLSCEPLLGPVDITGDLATAGGSDSVDWVIVGGESGPGARPMRPDWARSLRDQCVGTGVPFLFKQWGEWVPESQSPQDAAIPATTRSWAWSRGEPTLRLGKKAAGRELDGRTWHEYPQAVSS